MMEKEIISKESQKYTAISNLTHQEGWPLLLNHIKIVQERVMKALLTEPNPKEVIRLQERYRAFDAVITTVLSAESIKMKLFDDLQMILEEEALKEEFDI